MSEERLIIKNFGPIKHIDLLIRKVNVLIGNQGTGKSTIAKVLAICKNINFLKDPTLFFIDSEYNLSNYFQENTEITFSSKNYSVEIKSGGAIVSLSDELRSLLRNIRIEEEKISQPNFDISVITQLNQRFQKLVGVPTYIPTERSFVSFLNNNIYALINAQATSFTRYLLNFYQLYNFSRSVIKTASFDDFGVRYSYENGTDFLTVANSKKIRLNESASGLQSILPLLLTVEQMTSSNIVEGLFLIEEPELSLFPKTQYALVKHLIFKCRNIDDNILFTTHSPYVLSTINNLIYAHQVGQQNSDDVSKIIGQKYWLNPKDVSAYIMNEQGEMEDLMDTEINQLKVERIDEISNQIADEYDKLSDIKWAKK